MSTNIKGVYRYYSKDQSIKEGLGTVIGSGLWDGTLTYIETLTELFVLCSSLQHIEDSDLGLSVKSKTTERYVWWRRFLFS